MTGLSPRERLSKEPQRFTFDAAVRILLRSSRSADPAAVARFRTPHGLAYPAADVLDVEAIGATPQVTVGLFGLTGPSGVLPRLYTDLIVRLLPVGTATLHGFIDMLGDRMAAAFARAGMKYRLDRSVEAARLAGKGELDAHSRALLSIAGFAGSNITARLPVGIDALRHYAGIFAAGPRSAERLAALTSDWLGKPVEVIEFTGAWIAIPVDQRTRLPRGRGTGTFCRLGHDASVGISAWDPQANIVLRIGPLDAAEFNALMPDGAGLAKLVSLVRAYLGFQAGFAVNLVLAADAVPPLHLCRRQHPGPRLGWNTWLGRPGRPEPWPAADDPRFAAETVEAGAAGVATARSDGD